jgi:hypothetical protein
VGFLGRADSFQPGAYIHDDRTLFEIVGRTDTIVELENCSTGWRHARALTDLKPASAMSTSRWRIAKKAPVVPDHID